MIVGNGMIARAMRDVSDVLIFASGVSNSASVSEPETEREKQLLKSVRDDRKLVYFSTVTVAQTNKTPYIMHKLQMELLVREGPHLILRVANIVGHGQSPAQLIPSLTNQVIAGKVKVQDSVRDIMDVDDLSRILHQMLQKDAKGTHNLLTGRQVPINSLVACISQILGCDPVIERVPVSDYPLLNSPVLFDEKYYRRVLEK